LVKTANIFFVNIMRIESIKIAGFRNLEAERIDFFPQMNIFSGKNAQGKSNLLEAIYLCSGGFSPRTHRESELIGFQTSTAKITTEFVSNLRGHFNVDIEMSINRDISSRVKKKLLVNKAERNFSDIAGLVPVVLFWISDLDIVRESPSRRRSFLDVELSMMSRTYNWTLKQYNKTLEQRNKLLKQLRDSGTFSAELLGSFDIQLVQYGTKIIEIREKFLSELNFYLSDVYKGLTIGCEELTLLYLPNVSVDGDLADSYQTRLFEHQMVDYQRGVTSVGPHRDDFYLAVDGRDIRTYGSQGEGRTVALSLRVAEFKMLEKSFGETPILLLDDVMSELDNSRRQGLLNYLSPMAQVIVTTTNVDAIGVQDSPNVKHFTVDNGIISD